MLSPIQGIKYLLGLMIEYLSRYLGGWYVTYSNTVSNVITYYIYRIYFISCGIQCHLTQSTRCFRHVFSVSSIVQICSCWLLPYSSQYWAVSKIYRHFLKSRDLVWQGKCQFPQSINYAPGPEYWPISSHLKEQQQPEELQIYIFPQYRSAHICSISYSNTILEKQLTVISLICDCIF